MGRFKVFYSWQSDTPHQENRDFIREALGRKSPQPMKRPVTHGPLKLLWSVQRQGSSLLENSILTTCVAGVARKWGRISPRCTGRQPRSARLPRGERPRR
jgi:hypothetical protein